METWFSIVHRKALRRGVFRSVAQVKDAIQRFLDAWNSKMSTLRLGEDRRRDPRPDQCESLFQPGCTSCSWQRAWRHPASAEAAAWAAGDPEVTSRGSWQTVHATARR